MAQRLGDDQHNTLTLTVSDFDDAGNAVGNPRPMTPDDVTAPPQWAASDPTVLQVTAAADGCSAEARALGPTAAAVSALYSGTLKNGNSFSGSYDYEIDLTDVVSQQVAVSASTPEHN